MPGGVMLFEKWPGLQGHIIRLVWCVCCPDHA
jgi:hypothetical protein